MRSIFLLMVLTIWAHITIAQSLYFPPAGNTTWDTIAPGSLGWCQPNIDTLYNFLQAKNTDAFIILKDGKIVLEKYFGTFSADSLHDWFSASKSLTSMLTGIAIQNGIINIDSPATKYLGPGWTSETPVQEDSITIRNLLTMTSGTNPAPTGGCTNEDTSAACLQYLVTAGTQWAYHTGAYRKEETVLTNASGKGYDALSEIYLGSATGMTGTWFAQEFIGSARTAARFGLLALNHGIWANDTLLRDTAYFNAMTHTSQPYNLSYGYLWWLNGKASYMSPGTQVVFPGELVPNAPPDMFCALGKNDQKIYVIPSTNLVVVRLGEAADSVTDALSTFDNQLWGYIDNLACTTGLNDLTTTPALNIYPNPATGILYLDVPVGNTFKKISLYNTLGQRIAEYPMATQIDISQLPVGVYFLRINNSDGRVVTSPFVKQ